MGFWPEDQWDYSVEAETQRQVYRKQFEFFQQNMKKDSIAEAAKIILNTKNINEKYHKQMIVEVFDLDTLNQIIQEKTK